MSADRPDASRPDEPDPRLDVDAAFADIVAHYGDSPGSDVLADPASESGPSATEAPEPPKDQDPLRQLFTPAWPERDEPQLFRGDEDEHFVPPSPPPVPRPAPGRLLAWVALFGTPVLGLLLVVIHTAMPSWLTVGLVAAFVGGFAYLVATMTSEPPDHWSGDDGARL